MRARAIAPIRNELDYQAVLQDVRALWGAPPGSTDGDRLDVLMVLLEAYEAEHHRIEPADPIDAIQLRMEELGIDRGGIARVLATTSGRVSEILNRRRRLTIDMIRRLAAALNLSERCLLQPYPLAPRDRPSTPGPNGRGPGGRGSHRGSLAA
ncbi:MAG: HTH-type transcriptional regulator / antitoxin HigA [Acetobacteraceae bacterium]|jgi:HTH-type transcriptional regulator/antitoxin HigA|nr:HTH-type transcriptional regulator / antitoxin HigA [Acetobacteraceae bacterium]